MTISDKTGILATKGRPDISAPQEEYVMAAKAAHLLEVSKAKMAKVLRSDKIPYIPDPCNERTKLIN